MNKLIRFFYLVAIVSLPLACEGENDYKKEILHPQKKYFLSECLIKMNFSWEENIDLNEKASVTDKMGEILNRVLVNGKFPLFSYHTTNSRDYFVFYLADKCEKRKYFVEQIIAEHIESEIKEFPQYHIQDESIEIGFDGVTPSGWWKDY